MLRSPGPGVKDPDHISGILNGAPNRDIRERARLRGDTQHVAQALMYGNSYTAAGCSGLYGLTLTMAGRIYGRPYLWSLPERPGPFRFQEPTKARDCLL